MSVGNSSQIGAAPAVPRPDFAAERRKLQQLGAAANELKSVLGEDMYTVELALETALEASAAYEAALKLAPNAAALQNRAAQGALEDAINGAFWTKHRSAGAVYVIAEQVALAPGDGATVAKLKALGADIKSTLEGIHERNTTRTSQLLGNSDPEKAIVDIPRDALKLAAGFKVGGKLLTDVALANRKAVNAHQAKLEGLVFKANVSSAHGLQLLQHTGDVFALPVEGDGFTYFIPELTAKATRWQTLATSAYEAYGPFLQRIQAFTQGAYAYRGNTVAATQKLARIHGPADAQLLREAHREVYNAAAGLNRAEWVSPNFYAQKRPGHPDPVQEFLTFPARRYQKTLAAYTKAWNEAHRPGDGIPSPGSLPTHPERRYLEDDFSKPQKLVPLP